MSLGAPEQYDSRTQYRFVTVCQQIIDSDIISFQHGNSQKACDRRLKKYGDQLIEAVLDCKILETSRKAKEKPFL